MVITNPVGRLFAAVRSLVDLAEKIVPAQAVNTMLNRDFDNATELDWPGWASPAVMTVLHEHFPQEHPGGFDCTPGTAACPLWPDEQAWLEHVTPLLVERVGCDPKRAAGALARYRPD